MLTTRLWMGAILIGLAVGVLVVDQWLAPWYPILFLVVQGLAFLACAELLQLLRAAQANPVKPESAEGLPGPTSRPARDWLCFVGTFLLVAANWPAHVLPALWPDLAAGDPWRWIAGILGAVVLAAFLLEMAAFREAGGAVQRMAMTFWVIGYLGLLPCFLVQLRWLGSLSAEETISRGSLALALVIFVPKFGDSGAYFVGRLFGRHPMTPVLSPKKTWEGFVGAAAASALTAVGIDALGPALRGGLGAVVAFGLVVGLTGLLGDLAESLIKRDCRQKDASHILPGFGGVLDVVDSVIFAAPVAYWWFALT